MSRWTCIAAWICWSSLITTYHNLRNPFNPRIVFLLPKCVRASFSTCFPADLALSAWSKEGVLEVSRESEAELCGCEICSNSGRGVQLFGRQELVGSRDGFDLVSTNAMLGHYINWSDRKSVCSRVWCPGQLNLLDTKSEIVVSVHMCSETWRLLFSACSSLAMFAEARTGRIDLLWQRPMAGLATKQNDWAFGQIGIADWTKQCEGTSH